jgi:beta-RFAP synthase
MNALRIQTGSRLHFGLLGWGPNQPRQFGGVGLVVKAPELAVSAQPAPDWSAEGALADRCKQAMHTVVGRLREQGHTVEPLAMRVESAPTQHAGLGVGTQLSLAVARLLGEHAGLGRVPATTLALWTGRGRRSGIGLYGFDQGGLIVDGGHGASNSHSLPPLLARLEFPATWNVLLVVPGLAPGRHGADERSTFETLPAVPRVVSERLCHLLLTGILPAAAESDLPAFGEAVQEFQEHVGRTFAPAQGGIYAHPLLAELAAFLRVSGFHGVGQSSWGPAIYGFTESPREAFATLEPELASRFGVLASQLIWTCARNTGATIDRVGEIDHINVRETRSSD